MRVIVVGASKVGNALLKLISRENVDIVVIDENEEAIEEITNTYDCNGFVGNGSSPVLLKKAGIESASLLVALTKSDETNLLCCGVAKKFGVKRTVAAVRGPEFALDKGFMTENMGVDLMINPDKAGAREVNKLIRYVGDVEIEHFGDSNVNVATVEIPKDSILVDVGMPKVQETLGAQALICAIDRGGKMITPKGKHQIKAGDKITFVAIGDDMDKILAKLNYIEKVVKKTVIVGGGKVGYYLSQILMEQGGKVTLVDSDRARCEKLLELLPKAHVVCGDGSDSELMEQELKHADACVAMTGRDEENLIIAMFAKSFGMDHIAVEIDNEKFDAMLKKTGVKHTFSTQDVAIGAIVRDMRALVAEEDDNDNNVIKRFYSLNHGKVEAVEFELTPEFELLGIPFKDSKFKLKSGVLITVIVRDGQTIVPDGNSMLQVGDRVIVVSAEQKITKLTQIIA